MAFEAASGAEAASRHSEADSDSILEDCFAMSIAGQLEMPVGNSDCSGMQAVLWAAAGIGWDKEIAEKPAEAFVIADVAVVAAAVENSYGIAADMGRMKKVVCCFAVVQWENLDLAWAAIAVILIHASCAAVAHFFSCQKFPVVRFFLASLAFLVLFVVFLPSFRYTPFLRKDSEEV